MPCPPWGGSGVGLDQKVCGQVGALRTRPTQMAHHRRRDATSTTFGFLLRNVVSP
jgi:hypothetical protein